MSNAVKFLQEFLRDGPMPVVAVREAAEDFGISASELWKASQKLNVEKFKHKGGGKVWELPAEESKEVPTELT